MHMLPWALVLVAACSNGLGSLLLKHSQSIPGSSGISAYLSPYFFAGAAMFGVTLLIITRAFRDLPIIIAYPSFVSLTQIVVCIGAVMMGELLNVTQMVGIAIAVIGISILVVSSHAG